MPAEIDIDALKIFTKSRTNETEYWKKLKTAAVEPQDLPVLKRKCTSTCSLLNNFETLRPIVTVNIMILPNNNLKGTLLHLKNYSMEKVVLILH